MASVEVVVKNSEKCVQSIEVLIDRMEHLEGLYDAIGSIMVDDTQKLFDIGRDIDGNSFKPSIRAQLQGGKTLVDKGHLRSSIDYLATAAGVEWGATRGIPDVYAATHNFGRVIRPKRAAMLRFKVADRWVFKRSVTIPRRQFVGFNKRMETRIIEVINKHLEGEI